MSRNLFYGAPAMLDFEKAEATVRHVVGLLAAGDFGAVERLSDRTRLSSEDLRQSVAEYGGTVLPEPFEMSEPEPLDSGAGWWADVDLHTAEEGRSDLTLSLTLFDAPGACYGVRVDNLHVL